MRNLTLFLTVLFGFQLAGMAQQAPSTGSPAGQAGCCGALEQHMKEMEDRIILLEGQVRLLKEQLAQTAGAFQAGSPERVFSPRWGALSPGRGREYCWAQGPIP